jgi:hypothetical protein
VSCSTKNGSADNLNDSVHGAEEQTLARSATPRFGTISRAKPRVFADLLAFRALLRFEANLLFSFAANVWSIVLRTNKPDGDVRRGQETRPTGVYVTLYPMCWRND